MVVAETFTSYSLENDKSFKNALVRAQASLKDLRVVFGLILADWYRSEKSIFQLKGPGQYPPFKGKIDPKTGKTLYQIRKIKKYGFDYPLLVASGRLSTSLLSAGAPGSIAQIGPVSMRFGTSVEYGKYHQSDGPRPKMPLRKFLFIGPEARQFATSEQSGRLERWNNILNDSVLKQIRRELKNA